MRRTAIDHRHAIASLGLRTVERAVRNADEIGEAFDTLISLLQELRADLRDGDRLADVFDEANRWRSLLSKKP